MRLLTTNKGKCFVAATGCDLPAAEQVLRRESHKLNLLNSRLQIYETVLQQTSEVAFNEFRLSSTRTSRNDPKVQRAIVTFEQTGVLVDAASPTEITNNNKLIVDVAKINTWDHSRECYVMLRVFQRGTMEVYKRKFRSQYVQIKYFEASWPGAPVAHRIEPLRGSMNALSAKSMVSTSTLRPTSSCCTT